MKEPNVIMDKLAVVLFLAAVVVVALAGAEEEPATQQKLVVGKCCEVESILVEVSLGHRECRPRSDIHKSGDLNATSATSEAATSATSQPHNLEERSTRWWSPIFFDLEKDAEVPRPATYELRVGLPTCDGGLGEVMFAAYHHENTFDNLMLLTNGSLAHKLVHGEDGFESPTVIYPAGKYCVDDMVVVHNASGDKAEEDNLEFAYICVSNRVDVQTVMEDYVYPIGLCVSILCLILTFLLYSFLPQLRDLSGKFILAICAFQATAFSLILVDLFGWKDSNVHSLTAELLLHASVVGIWFSLNSMGHHVWKIILSKSVFTRVTDGRRLLCYSVYVVSGVAAVCAVAVSLHFFIAGGGTMTEGDSSDSNREVSWECLAGFYMPVSALLLVNVFFYWTAQRTMAKQMLYNRSMQHFQVNFDLYIKFLLVEGVWWLFFMLSLLPDMAALTWISRVFDVVHGPLVFCVAMCRTRVAFLFKKYFCHDGCCFGCCGGGGEFIDEADGGGVCQELSVIDRLREKADQQEEDDDGEEGLASRVTTALLSPISMPSARNGRDEMSRSLFNVRNKAECSEVPPPANTELPLGRVKRLLKSNSMTAIANINFGWRRETSV